MKYTITDIAKMTGYSKKTVSRVINNEPTVKPSTREAIQSVIAETNYQPNVYARNLNKKYVRNILISIRKGKNQNTTAWLELMLLELINTFDANKYNIVNEVVYDDKHSVIGSDVTLDFAIIFYADTSDFRIERAKEIGLQYLIFGKTSQGPYVSNDNRESVITGTEFLFSRGAKKITLLLGNPYENNLERAAGIKEAYNRNKKSLEDLDIVFGMTNLNKIYDYVDKKVKADELPDAIFVSGDEKVIAVYHALYDNGISIPDDISILGFDNIPISSHYYPPLSTIAQDYRSLSEAINKIIVDYFEDGLEPKSVEVPTKLIERSSVK